MYSPSKEVYTFLSDLLVHASVYFGDNLHQNCVEEFNGELGAEKVGNFQLVVASDNLSPQKQH